MTVKNITAAWTAANAIFPTDYLYDSVRSENAGYPIYHSTAAGVNAWISDLGNRLEVNLPDGQSVNIWVEPQPEFAEYQLADALEVISDAIDAIDDKVLMTLQRETGIDEARKTLYGAYAKIAEILRAQHPDSRLFAMYALEKD